jgi:hypothetical protein
MIAPLRGRNDPQSGGLEYEEKEGPSSPMRKKKFRRNLTNRKKVKPKSKLKMRARMGG